MCSPSHRRGCIALPEGPHAPHPPRHTNNNHQPTNHQGSPTVSNPRPETFRHALAVTTTRPGLDGAPYLYTLNLSCPQVCMGGWVCVKRQAGPR
jgi:hypothetical protein